MPKQLMLGIKSFFCHHLFLSKNIIFWNINVGHYFLAPNERGAFFQGFCRLFFFTAPYFDPPFIYIFLMKEIGDFNKNKCATSAKMVL